MQHIWDSLKLAVNWLLIVIAGVTLDRLAVTLAVIYSILQISAFFYPWHKKLWKYLGVKD